MLDSSCGSQTLILKQLSDSETIINTNSISLLISCHGQEQGPMILIHASTSLSFFLIIIHLFSFLLVKLFSSLLRRESSKAKGDIDQFDTTDNEKTTESVDDCQEDEDLVSDFFGGEEGLFFFYSENSVEDALLSAEGRDNSEQHSLEAKKGLVSYEENVADEEHKVENGDVPSPTILTAENQNFGSDKSAYPKDFEQNELEKDSGNNDEGYFVKDHLQFDSKRFDLEDVHGDKETLGGSLTCESTSKSSLEYRCSTFFRDSETEYPFSSSSRRSSSNWETFALFRKYDEEMMLFDRISAQKLSETESFRTIKYQPRSISQRIQKLMTRNKNVYRNPYQELESAYVAQVCLAWEALNLDYNNFRRKIAERDKEASFCPARIAQQFQQFQVLLQRFIENEPYEDGRRPEVFARIRKTSPKLLQVPEYRDSEDESKEDMISTNEFLVILEEVIRTFLNFLKADKENPCQKIKAMVKRKSRIVDPNLLHSLKRANKKKKMRLKDLMKSKRCLKKRKMKVEQEMEIIMGLIDMKVVSRVLRMAGISQDQLHWCEEKMTKVRVSDGKIQRDSSPLFFPVQ